MTDKININSVIFSGSEPLLYKNILRIIKFLNKKNIKTGLSTNGVLLNKKNIKNLINAGINNFEISLDSLNAEVYKKITGKNYLKKTIDNIINLRSIFSNVSITYQLNALNINEIKNIIQFCNAFLIKHLNIYFFIPSGKGSFNKKELLITDNEINKSLSIINNLNNNKKLEITIFPQFEECKIIIQNFKNLDFGLCSNQDKIIIDPEGNLRKCDINPWSAGNILKKDINKLLKLIDNYKCPVKIKCNECLKKFSCKAGCIFL